MFLLAVENQYPLKRKKFAYKNNNLWIISQTRINKYIARQVIQKVP